MFKSIFKNQLMAVSGLILIATVCAHAEQVHQVPQFLDVATRINGSLLITDQKVAEHYCARQGARLPSVRELALYAMSYGARGIVEIVDGPPSPDEFYVEISAINADGTLDRFYYSYDGYRGPLLWRLGLKPWPMERSLWSSSVSSYHRSKAYAISGGFGTISPATRKTNDEDHIGDLAVRCVLDR